jgi:hypothetical protein
MRGKLSRSTFKVVVKHGRWKLNLNSFDFFIILLLIKFHENLSVCSGAISSVQQAMLREFNRCSAGVRTRLRKWLNCYDIISILILTSLGVVHHVHCAAIGRMRLPELKTPNPEQGVPKETLVTISNQTTVCFDSGVLMCVYCPCSLAVWCPTNFRHLYSSGNTFNWHSGGDRFDSWQFLNSRLKKILSHFCRQA